MESETDYRVHDLVKTPVGTGIITATEFGEVFPGLGMPYTVGFPDGDFDHFEACDLQLVARPLWRHFYTDHSSAA